MATRSDRIVRILDEAKNRRLPVKAIAEKLASLEHVTDLHVSTVSATVIQDNNVRKSQGRPLRFNTYGDGTEAWGYVSLRPEPAPVKASQPVVQEQIPPYIEKANDSVREQLRAAIGRLTWQEFESNFLARILDALGFQSIEITQPTRDGGKDAVCRYQRGIVSSEAIVSAKHWQAGSVPVDEVQRLRGIKHSADTGIIVTSARFTADAKKDAEPSQNTRAIVLIDGDLIVDTCLAHSIGVVPVKLPTLYEFLGFEASGEGEA